MRFIMGRPTNKKNFGSGNDKLSIRFYNGTSLVDGYVVKQTSTNTFIVSDGTSQREVQITSNEALARRLSGIDAIGTTSELVGWATIGSMDNGTQVFIRKLTAHKAQLLSGVQKLWKLGATVVGGIALPNRTQATPSIALRIIGAGGEMPTFQTAAAVAFQTRYPFVVAEDCSEISFTFDGKIVSTNGEQNGTNGYYLGKVAMERTDVSASIPVTFSGSRVRAIANTDYAVTSDTITAASLGLSVIPKGFSGFIRSAGYANTDKATTGSFPAGPILGVTGGRSQLVTTYDDAFVDGTGTLTSAGTGLLTAITYTAIIGRPVNAKAFALIANGDSLTHGAGDTSGYVGGTTDYPMPYGNGPYARACWSAGASGTFAYMKFARTGGFDFLGINGAAGNPALLAYAAFANAAAHGPGTNDLAANHNPTTVLTNAKAAWALLRTAGIKKILRPSLFPRVTGTVLLADGSDQTAGGTDFPDWNPGGNRDTLEGLYQAQVGISGGVDYYFDVATSVMLAGSSRSKWNADGTTGGRASVDKTHPAAPYGWNLAAPAYRAAVLQAKTAIEAGV
jgi:hypothetical protein